VQGPPTDVVNGPEKSVTFGLKNHSTGHQKDITHRETFSEIFEGLEFKSPFKKPQMIEDFWSSFKGILWDI
jgi:hypothetical protein